MTDTGEIRVIEDTGVTNMVEKGTCSICGKTDISCRQVPWPIPVSDCICQETLACERYSWDQYKGLLSKRHLAWVEQTEDKLKVLESKYPPETKSSEVRRLESL